MENNRQGRLEKKISSDGIDSLNRRLSTSIKDRVKLYETQIEECKIYPNTR
jgi:hypothetical protein